MSPADFGDNAAKFPGCGGDPPGDRYEFGRRRLNTIGCGGGFMSRYLAEALPPRTYAAIAEAAAMTPRTSARIASPDIIRSLSGRPARPVFPRRAEKLLALARAHI